MVDGGEHCVLVCDDYRSKGGRAKSSQPGGNSVPVAASRCAATNSRCFEIEMLGVLV